MAKNIFMKYWANNQKYFLKEINDNKNDKDKLVAIDLILPPRPRKPPTLPNKQTLPLMRPEDILRNREIRLVRCG